MQAEQGEKEKRDERYQQGVQDSGLSPELSMTVKSSLYCAWKLRILTIARFAWLMARSTFQWFNAKQMPEIDI